MSEIRNIPLGGVSNEPDDYNAEDGGLSVSINAVKHHGSLRPVMPGSPVEDIGELPDGADVVAIHEVGEMKHYILLREDTASESATQIRNTLYYQNLPGKVRVWWSAQPKGYSLPRGNNMVVCIGDGENVYKDLLEKDKAIDIPGEGLCIGGDDYYDYDNGKILTDDNITMVVYTWNDQIEEPINLKIVNADGLSQTGGVEDEADDTEGNYMLMYIDANADNKGAKEIASFSDKVIGVAVSGNVLTIAREGKPPTYVIWKEAEYRKLGSRLPGLKATPYLVSSPAYIGDNGIVFSGEWEVDNSLTDLGNDVYTETIKNAIENSRTAQFTLEEKKALANRVFGLINLAHNSLANNGYFYAPFLVRFALRMYDGKHIMHTPPQLMIAGAAGKPIVGVYLMTGDNANLNTPYLRTVFCASRLCANIEVPEAELWKDLITHVDVFVSPPLVDYTDSQDSIHQLGMANIPHNLPDSPVLDNKEMPEYNSLYMKNFKTIGNLYEDYMNMASHPFRITYNTFLKNRNYSDFQRNILAGVFSEGYLLVKHGTDYTMTIEGNPVSLTGVTGDEEVTTIGDKTYKLKDTDIPELNEYAFYKFNKGEELKDVRFASQTSTSVVYTVCVQAYSRKRSQEILHTINIENSTETPYLDRIVENNTFHLIKSLAMQDIADGWKGDLAIPKHTLPIISTQKELTDNGQMRNRVFCDIPAFAYNNRLSISVQGESLPTSSRMADFCLQSTEQDSYIERAWIKAVVNGQEVYKRLEIGTDGNRATYAENIRYFYYPDHNATHLILQVLNKQATSGIFQTHIYSLDKHKLLNGTYIFNKFEPIVPDTTRAYFTREELAQDEDIKNAVNGKTEASFGSMVKVSGVSNPFYFNETHQVTLPTGTISGLSTTAKALSQGQFGAFPLYCFSDNGIWALEVSDTGTYSAKQPVSRAVCTNPESITQTDGEVLFVTKRGLMSISGSETSCISEVLSGHNYTSKISKLAEVMNLVGMENVEIPTHVEDWMQEAKFLYDDMRQYIYAFRDGDTLGYIYSMSDKAWGMFLHDLAHPLPCYTDALAVTNPDNNNVRKLINLSDYTNCGDAPKSLIITRPLAMGVPDGHKTLESLITRGMLDKDDAHLVIWASNDLKKWAIVGTSTTSWYRGKSGTPYKYYRIGLLLDWEEEDSVSGISADVTTRLTNRMR